MFPKPQSIVSYMHDFSVSNGGLLKCHNLRKAEIVVVDKYKCKFESTLACVPLLGKIKTQKSIEMK